MKLENERLCVEIADMGAEVTRIYDKRTVRMCSGRRIRYIGNGILRCFSRM